MEHGSRTRLIAGVILVLVFGSGVLLGFAADANLAAESSDVRAEEGESNRSEGERPRRTPVYEQLDPSEAQRELIDSIIAVRRDQMNRLDKEYRDARRAYRANYDVVVQDTREAIADVFPPERAAEYRQLLAEYDRRREAARRDGSDRR